MSNVFEGNSNRTSRLRAAWADIRNSQRLLGQHNRPWVASPRRSS